MSAPLIEVRDLTLAYAGRSGPIRAVRSASFTLGRGETLGLVGESGSGKSTLGAALLRLPGAAARRTEGTIVFDGIDLGALPEADMRKLRGARIAMILQDPLASLNPLFTAGRQIAEVPRTHLGLAWSAALERAAQLLTAVRIADPHRRIDDHPHQLSGGMRQRVAGAIALAGSPDLIIADEPTTALDPTVQLQYLDMLKAEQRARGFALILISHDLAVVRRVCDRIAVMYAGRLVETGPAAQVLAAPRHPYTAALTGALPAPGRRAGSLTVIPGTAPSLAALPPGCAFHPRCGHASARCREEEPESRSSMAGSSACHYPLAAAT
ncbi:MAG: ABC transporter ATP-binding protein [Burkholderiales bacterium]|nr:ABC transporter ATP-binding protein [Burkholderiales bacterium]